MKNTFKVVLPDGVEVTRKTGRNYTHAVICKDEKGYGVLQFAGTLVLANQYAKNHTKNGWNGLKVMPVSLVSKEPKPVKPAPKKRGKKPTGKKKEQSCNQFLDMDAWIEMYNATKRLPCNKIICATCRKNYTSMFGDNLKRTVVKYGGILQLLDSFECRECRKLSTPAKGKKQSKKEEAKPAKPEKKVLSLDEIEDRKEFVRSTLPKFDPDAKPTKIDFNSPEAVAEITKGACQRPDIYLDAGCKYCPLAKYCACASKDMSRDVINEGRSKPRKRKAS